MKKETIDLLAEGTQASRGGRLVQLQTHAGTAIGRLIARAKIGAVVLLFGGDAALPQRIATVAFPAVLDAKVAKVVTKVSAHLERHVVIGEELAR